MIDQEKELLEKNYRRVKEDLEDVQRYVDELTVFLPLSFCTVNPLHLILGVNHSFQKLTGYKEMEIIGNDIDSLFLEKKEVENFRKEILSRNQIFNKELTFVKKNGDLVPVSVSALARTDDHNNFLGYFLTISDITEIKEFQKQLEEKVMEKTKALEKKTEELIKSRKAIMNILEDTEEARQKVEEEKKKTETIITNFTDGLLVFDKNGVVVLVNPKANRYLETNSEEIVNKNLNDLKKNPKTKNLGEILSQSSIFKNKEKTQEESEKLKEEIKNSRNSVIEIVTVPIFEKGKKINVLVVLHDITREKMIEEMKSEFVSIAAHQLRTPLSAIKWTIKMLLDGDLGKLNKEQQDLAEKAYLSNSRMVDLINDLLNVSRIEEGRYLYKPSHISLSEIIDPLLEIYKSETKRRKINFEIDKPNNKLPGVAVDVEKITLVIQNLLDNAIKYTSENGSVTFSVKVNSKEKKIEVSVKDNGVGIPKDQQNRLFSKFFRAANVIRMETEGSGLGLFICKNIINVHDGKIWFESEEGKGSIFRFTLPMINTEKEFEEFLKKL